MDTILLAWNPKKWDWNNLKEEVTHLKTEGSLNGRWSCGTRKNIPIGSRFFLIRLGENPKGIIGSGYTTNLPQQGKHFINPNKLAWYIDISYDVLSEQPIISREFLDLPPYNEFHWDTQMSGINIPPSLAILIENKWSEQLGNKETINSHLKYTANDYIKAFQQQMISPYHLRMLQAHYHAPNKMLTATQMSKIMGYQNFNAANLHYGKLGKIIGNNLGWSPLPVTTLHVLAEFEKPEREWFWIMRPEVAEALEKLGWIDSEQHIIPEEIYPKETLYEGSVKSITINAYERNSVAREKCILNYGCTCTACGLNLADMYGEVAQGYIHIHHLRQLADIHTKYEVDPIQDLRPVCPNCHAIIHMKSPSYTIDEIKELIKNKKIDDK